MAPKYKLVYFDTRGRGEAIRWIFAYAGQDFEDVRIKYNEWPALKASAPQGQVPYLEIDGKQLPQSSAIARYLARQFGLAGSNDFEAAQVDAVSDSVNDAFPGFLAFFLEKDEAKKAVLKEAYFKEGVHKYLKGLERQLLANNNGEGFFVGSKPSWADFVAVTFFDNLSEFDRSVLDNYTVLQAHSQRVHELKGIKEWLVKRPVG